MSPESLRCWGSKRGTWTACLTALTFVHAAGAATYSATAFDDGLPKDGQWRNGFEIADMDRDGHVDIGHGPPRKGPAAPVIFLGDGLGRWAPWAASYPDLPYTYGDVATADFDGDGFMDVALAMHRQGIVVLRGDGDGRFESWSAGLPWIDRDDSELFTSRCVESVDWNRDGRMDLVASWEGFTSLSAARGQRASMPTLAVFLNEGDGTWRAVRGPAEPRGVFGDSIALLHLDDSPGLDVVFASQCMSVSAIGALNRDGAGWQSIACPGLPDRTFVTSVSVSGPRASRVLIGRLSHNGAKFVSAVDGLRYGEGPELTREPLLEMPDEAAITALACRDLNGDGVDDVAAGRDDGRVHLFLASANGALHPMPFIGELQGTGRCYGLELHDMDGDGTADVVASFARETQSIGSVLVGTSGGSGSIRIWKLLVNDIAHDTNNQSQPAAHKDAPVVLTGALE